MKRFSVILCALLLLAAVWLDGCGRRNTTAVPEPIPEATAEPTPADAEDTASPIITTPMPAATAAPATPTPTPEPILKKSEEKTQFYLLVRDGKGANALFPWLMGEGKDGILSFTTKTGEQVFLTAPGMAGQGAVAVAPSDGKDRRAVLFVDSFFLECGVLREILPAFEKKYGYEIEVLSASAEETDLICRSADLAILRSPVAQDIRQKGVFATFWPYIITEYTIEAP